MKSFRILPGFYCFIACLTGFFALVSYPGRWYVYILFTIVLNGLFVLGFTKRRIFFDTFIGIFFWLGFWLKYSFRMAFLGGEFQAPELIGRFKGTAFEHDQVLLVASCGIGALLVASFIRRRFFFTYNDVADRPGYESIFTFYKRHRAPILSIFFLLFVTVAVGNVILGIYQRGALPKTILPMGLGGVYAWLLLFGLASASAVMLDCEFRLKNNPYLASIMAMLESFFSNVSMISRGMVLNAGSLIIGMSDNVKRRSQHPGPRYKLTVFVVFMVLFLSSVVVVNEVREKLFFSDFPTRTNISKSFLVRTALKKMPFKIPESAIEAAAGVEVLLIDRWIGIEGVMSVVGHRGLGWGLWKKAWQEKYSHSGTSMYDLEILRAPLSGLKNHHFISLPGILAFCYYPGSYPFLFFSMFLLGLFAAGVEFFVYRAGGANIILCALLGQVVAYRYAHFGYVPAQSYLLFGSLIINVLMFYFLEKLLSYRERRTTPDVGKV